MSVKFEKSARDELRDMRYDLFVQLNGILKNHIQGDDYTKAVELIWQREDLFRDLLTETDEELERSRLFEKVYLKKCPMCSPVDEQCEVDKHGGELPIKCPYKGCPEYGGCWPSQTTKEPVTVIYLEAPPEKHPKRRGQGGENWR